MTPRARTIRVWGASAGLALALAGSSIAGCFVMPDAPAGNASRADAGSSSSGNAAPDEGACSSTGSGLPAAVQAMLVARCQSCHGSSPSSPMSLLNHADLVAAARSDANRSVAELVLERIQSADRPMPPGSGVSVPSEEIEAFRSWLTAGMPREEGEACSEADGGSTTPPAAETVCSSNQHWDSGRKGARMNPGRACISCHEREEDDPVVWLGGTVYPTFHEPDLCYGADASDAKVIITQADDSEIVLSLTDTGNFSISAEDAPALRFPIRARVEWQGRVRAMNTPQESADCNGCHTERGANGAPGRIALP